MNFEFPLVFFTVFSQLGLGLGFVGAWKMLQGEVVRRSYWSAVIGVTTLGLVASLFHLGNPLGAVTTLNGLEDSWLSREILAFGCFMGALCLMWLKPGRPAAAGVIVLGAAALVVQGFTYAPVSLPAIHNGFTPLFFTLTALALGTTFNSGMAVLQRVMLVLLVVVLLLAPTIWATGGHVMRDTAHQWLVSPFFWGGIALTCAVLALSFAGRPPRRVQGCLLVCGALLLRMTFFESTVHTATRLGMPY